MRQGILGTLLLFAGTCAASPKDKVIDYYALYYATQHNNVELAEALLERGAPVDALDPDVAGSLSLLAIDMDSPLQAAAANGNVKIVRLLLAHKPWVDHHCCRNPTALGMATDAGHLEVVRLLLEAGADPSVKGEYQDPARPETPLQVAERKGHSEIARLLRAARPRGRP
jgi:ankyrin repeat protein